MSDQDCPWTNGSGDVVSDNGGVMTDEPSTKSLDKVQENCSNETRKRTRSSDSSDSASARSSDSNLESSLKKPKVAVRILSITSTVHEIMKY